MKKTNILYICPSSGLGGAETFLKTTLLSQDTVRFSSIYLLFQKGPLYDWLITQKANVEVLPQRPRLSRPLSIYNTHCKIRDVIRNHKIDLVHSTMAYGALFAAKAAQAEDCPHVWFQHGPASGWMDQLASLLPHHAVFVNSDYTLATQQALEKNIKPFINKNRFFQKIDLGTPPPTFLKQEVPEFKKSLLAKLHLPAETLLFAMACRLQKWKGVELVIEASRILAKNNKPFFVFIWGETFDSTDYVVQIKKAAQNLPVSFEGPVNQVPLAFAACDVVINASLQPEPFGLTMIEALSVGRALLGPNEGGPAEIIIPDVTGLCFTPRSAVSLAENMTNMINNRSLVEKMQSQALLYYERKYTSTQMMKSVEQVYDKILQT